MAMCSGWWLSQLLRPMHPSPFWGLLGPTTPVYDSDLQDAMEAFYSHLLATSDAKGARVAMNEKARPKDGEYRFDTAELIYCRVFHRYIKDYCKPEQLTERENEIVAEIVRRNNYILEVAFEARDRARRMLSNHREFFSFYRTNFFMLESIPGNDTRFRLAYEDCAGANDNAHE